MTINEKIELEDQLHVCGERALVAYVRFVNAVDDADVMETGALLTDALHDYAESATNYWGNFFDAQDAESVTRELYEVCVKRGTLPTA